MKKLASILVVLLLGLSFAQDFPVTITDRWGRELTFEEPPERIVCFYSGCMRGFGPLAQPVAFPTYPTGLADVGNDTYYPGFAEVVTILDTTGGIDPEIVAAFEPDLIVAFTEEEIATYESIAPVMAEFNVTSVDEAVEAFLDYARILGREAEAQDIAQASLDRLTAYQALAPNDRSYMTVLYQGDGNQFIRTSNSSECQVLEGLVQCPWPDPTGGVSWSYEATSEAILDLNPDVMYVSNATGSSERSNESLLEEFISNPLIAASDAVLNDSVHTIQGYFPVGNGIRSMDQLLDTLMPLIYPEVFPEALTDEQVQEILASQ